MGYADSFNNDQQLEDSSTWRKLLNYAFTPVKTALDVLDTPGAIVRSLLSGKDANIFNPDQRPTGRDVLNNLFGYTPQSERASIGGFDVPSFATSIVTDPLMLLTGIVGKTAKGVEATRLGKAESLFSLAEGKKDVLRAAGATDEAAYRGADELSSAIKKTPVFEENAINKSLGVADPPLGGSWAEQARLGQRGVSTMFGTPEGFNKSVVAPIMENAPRFVPEFMKNAAGSIGGATKAVADKLFARGPQTDMGQMIKELRVVTAGKSALEQKAIRENSEEVLSKGVAVPISRDVLGEQVVKQLENKDVPAMIAKEKAVQHSAMLDQFKATVEKTKNEYDIKIANAATPQEAADLRKTMNGVLKGHVTRTRNNWQEKLNEFAQISARVRMDQGQFTLIGGTADLVKHFDNAETLLNIEQATKSSITKLDDYAVNYVQSVATPEGWKLFNENKKFRDEWNSTFAQPMGIQKERTLRNMTLEDKNKFYRDKYKVDFDVFSTDPVDIQVSRNLAHSNLVDRSANLQAAINLAGDRQGLPNQMELGEFLKGKLTGIFLPDGTSIDWPLGASKEHIQAALRNHPTAATHIDKTLVDDLTKLEQFDAGDLEGWLRFADPVNTLYRSWLTAVPAHSITNMIGNTVMNWIAGVNPFKQAETAPYLLRQIALENPEGKLAKLIPLQVKIDKKLIKSELKSRGIISFEENPQFAQYDAFHLDYSDPKLGEKFNGSDYTIQYGKDLTLKLAKTDINKAHIGSINGSDIKKYLPDIVSDFNKLGIEHIDWVPSITGGTKTQEARVRLFNYLIEQGHALNIPGTDTVISRNITNRLDDFYQEARENGTFSHSIVSEVKGMQEANPAKGILATAAKNPVTEMALDINSYFENLARFTHYVEKRRAGFNPIEAKQSVNKYLFDYNDLSQFEKKFMKKFVLFYTFARKNLPLSVTEMIANRRAYALGKISADNLAGQDYVPEYVKTQGGLSLGEGTYVDTKNPLYEANRFSPQGGGTQRVLDRAGSMLSPLFKVPLELYSGREMFRGKPLEDLNRVSPAYKYFPGVHEIQTKQGTEYRVNPTTLELLKNNPLSRQTGMFEDAINPEISFAPSLFGLRTRQLDPEKARKKVLRDRIESLLSEQPSVRKFGEYFDTRKEPDKKTQAMLKTLRELNK